MSKALDIQGNIYSNLTVLVRVNNDKRQRTQWLCRCKCGEYLVVRGSHLVSGNTKSCGCTEKPHNIKHGMCGTRIYNIWRKMLDRCYNVKAINYAYYGARGVRVCEEWHSFEGFYEWVKTTDYNDFLSIDRINSFGNYEPSNCRWADVTLQNINTSKTHTITIGMETKTITEWADAVGVSRSTILNRMMNGMSPEAAVMSEKYRRSYQ